MSNANVLFDAESLVRKAFEDAHISVAQIEPRRYPDETILIVYVHKVDSLLASELANKLDRELANNGFRGFVTSKHWDDGRPQLPSNEQFDGLADRRVTQMVNLITARSRTSEAQPSLDYVLDAQDNIATITSARHHLIFGRRGAGKTALLAEARRIVKETNAHAIWINVQTYRHESADRFFLYFARQVCNLIQVTYGMRSNVPRVLLDAEKMIGYIDERLAQEEPSAESVRRLVPQMQALLKRFLDSSDSRLFIIIDDFYYMRKDDQPLLLDLVHGCVRDCNAWLKIATIKHLTRWYDNVQQLGLEIRDDASYVDLDVTLQHPREAKNFLEQVLLVYARHSGIDHLSRVWSKEGLDRLVLASGAVPRDYLLLCASSVQEARQRDNAKHVGIQDVNKAAGKAKQLKLSELEDDAASTGGEERAILQALSKVSEFCIDEKNWTSFRVDFRDREEHSNEYRLLVRIVDLRLVHLIESSLSDEREAGRRSEVYMLDLSQVAVTRVKRKLRMFDFSDGNLVLRETGSSKPVVVGKTVVKRLGLLRRAPLFSLSELEQIVRAAGLATSKKKVRSKGTGPS